MNIDTQVKPHQDTIEATVERIIFKDESSGFHIMTVSASKQKLFTATATNIGIQEGMTYKLLGNWRIHNKYGRQFDAKTCSEVPPSTTEGLISYLSSSFFNGVGPVKARKIVKHFGDDTMKVLEENIDRLVEVKGINNVIAQKIKKGWNKHREINSIMQFLMEYKISLNLAGKIYEYYGTHCVARIKKNPFQLARDIRGIGFKKVDEIAMNLGFKEDSPLRLKACILYVLERSSDEGHTFLYEEQIIEKCREYLGKSHDLNEHFVDLDQRGELIILDEDSEPRFYERFNYASEAICYQVVKKMASQEYKNKFDEEEFKKMLQKDSLDLSDEQYDAVVNSLNHGISVLTGGPGCGKTYTTQAIVAALERLDKSITLCAPTGRAAKRMTEVIGKEAVTIHRLLSWDPQNQGFAVNEHNRMRTDFIIIDESSMIDMRLASALLRALPKNNCQALFIGDPDQLPPVGAGDFFKHLIKSNKVHVSALTKIFRQATNSEIIKFSHQINEGEVPNIETPLLNPELMKEKMTDCLFIDSGFSNGQRADSFPKHSSLRYKLNTVQMIEKVYKESIPNNYHNPDDVQVLIPMKKGAIGTIEVNKMLQASVNPSASNKDEFKIGERVFRQGDKVIQLVNNYDLNVFNGDVGRVISCGRNKEGEERVQIRYGKDMISYSRTDMLDVDLAYAITIHKSQGSEFDFVIVPLVEQHYRMLYRNLVYTAITRAKKLVIFIGSRKSMVMAVNNNKYKKRQSSLSEMLSNSVEVPYLLLEDFD